SRVSTEVLASDMSAAEVLASDLYATEDDRLIPSSSGLGHDQMSGIADLDDLGMSCLPRGLLSDDEDVDDEDVDDEDADDEVYYSDSEDGQRPAQNNVDLSFQSYLHGLSSL